MAGGTFTISNGGVFGSLYGTPIINVPQSAILGMHSIKERPIAVNGKVLAGDVVFLWLLMGDFDDHNDDDYCDDCYDDNDDDYYDNTRWRSAP